MRKKFIKQKKMVRVTDEWYPNYPGDLVQVSFHEDEPGVYRIAVWGEDDMGMGRTFTDKGDARAMYRKLEGPLSQDYLRTLGFKQA